jgi:membrane-bound lytic murein transglycosylase A
VRGPGLLALAGLFLLAACATAPTPRPIPGPTPRPAVPAPAQPQSNPQLQPSAEALRPLSNLPGWAEEDHAAAFEAWRANCRVRRIPGMAEACRDAMAVDLLDAAAARDFFERRFLAQPLPGEGVLTGYFAPVYEARRTPDGIFTAPLRPRPADLPPEGGVYPDRARIEARPAPDALAWLKPEEKFFLQIQGSGTLVFPVGPPVRAVFAGTNSQTFSGVANAMRERGLLEAGQTSAEGIRSWLAAHRGPEADAIMALNPRYVFFRLGTEDGLPPSGAAGVPLPPGRAIAVDLSRHVAGDLYWIDARSPLLSGAIPAYRRLVTALDTGGAIRGDIRADLYLGQGPEAGLEAGRIRHVLRLYRLVPRP